FAAHAIWTALGCSPCSATDCCCVRRSRPETDRPLGPANGALVAPTRPALGYRFAKSVVVVWRERHDPQMISPKERQHSFHPNISGSIGSDRDPDHLVKESDRFNRFHIALLGSYFNIENKNVLIIGCNRGEDCQFFMEKEPSHIVGIDISPEIGS